MVEQIKNKIATLVENTRTVSEKNKTIATDFVYHLFDMIKNKSDTSHCFFGELFTDDVYRGGAQKAKAFMYDCFMNGSYTYAYSQITDTIVHINVSKDMQSNFFNCIKLETIPSLLLSTSNIHFYNTFYNCANLKNIKILGYIYYSLDMSSCSLLSPDSMLNIITKLNNYSSDDENAFLNKITFHSAAWDNLNKTISFYNYLRDLAISEGVAEDEVDSTLAEMGLTRETTWQDFVTMQGWLI